MNAKYKINCKNGKHSFEHRDVMEEILGRELTSDEVVHHIDGNPRNNSEDNLVVMTPQEHIRLHLKGKKRPAYIGRKISKILTGRKLSDEHRRKISEVQKGKKLSTEQVEFLRQLHLGKKKSKESIKKRTKTREIHKERISSNISKGLRESAMMGIKSKLCADDVREIRRLFAEGTTQADLARTYEVQPSNISQIVNRKSWSWLE